ncbi:MAG: hypothetical protein V1489_01280 [Candidatus Liptonbacteria bacterium]
MPSPFLVTRPEYELVTRYFYRWAEPVIEEATRKGCEIIDLDHDKANHDRLVGTLRKKPTKMLVMLNGHGNKTTIAGDGHKAMVDVADADCFKGKIVYARACESAAELGPAAVLKGAVAYIGYDIPFTFLHEGKSATPLEDETAALFLEPSNAVCDALLKGHSAGEANARSRAKYRHNIQQILISDAKGEYSYALSFLFDDMEHQLCLGNQDARV